MSEFLESETDYICDLIRAKGYEIKKCNRWCSPNKITMRITIHKEMSPADIELKKEGKG